MKQLFVILMVGLVASVWSGCGGDSPTGDGKGKLLVWTNTYDDESVKEEYQYYYHPENNKRVKYGWYNSYYYDGNYEEVGTYTEDKKDGKWTEWYDWTKLHDDEGKIKESEHFYKDGKLDGKWTSWDEDGQIYKVDTYKKGKIISTKMWNEDGSLKTKV